MRSPSSSKLVDLLLSWQQQRTHGKSVTPEALCLDAPELLDALKSQIAAVQASEKAGVTLSFASDSGTLVTNVHMVDAEPDQSTLAEGDQRTDVPSVPPGYKYLAELGRGGMGVVFKARDLKLNRIVAIKMILGNDDEKAVIRFLAEAEAVAAIRHPSVVEVHQFGEHAGRPFMALEYCSGGSLADWIKAGTIEPEVAAEMLAAVAEGVGAAHAAGIVHRDMKPQNVLLTADGLPKVTDFGLAKRAATDAHLTKTNAIMGTPAYMAPEQAQGGTKFVGPQADVWALGVMLYEMVSGKRPFLGNDPWTLLAAVMKGEPTPLRKVARGVPRDLALICTKCLSKEPRDRYAEGAELAADLRRFVAGEPVSVRPPGKVRRLTRWVLRNRMATAAMLAIVSSMAIGTGVSLTQAKRARLAAERADNEARQAERDRDAARYEAFRAEDARNAIQLQFAYSNFEKQDYEAAALALSVAYDLPEAVRDRWENQLVHGALTRVFEPVCSHLASTEDLNDVFPLLNLFGQRDERAPVWNWCLSADGSRLAVDSPSPLFGLPREITVNGKTVETKAPTEIRIWDMQTRESLLDIPAKNKAICGLAFDPAIRWLAAACIRSLIIWDAKSGDLLREVPVPQGGTFISVCFSADSKRLFCGGYDGHVRVINPTNGNIVQTFPVQEVRKGEPLRVRCLKLTSDGKYLVGGLGRTNKDESTVGRVVVWDAMAGEQKPGLMFADVPVQLVSMDISRQGELLATTGQTGDGDKTAIRNTVHVWKLSNGELLKSWDVPSEAPRGIAARNDSNGAFRMMMDLQTDGTGRSVELSQVNRGAILHVCFDPSGKQVATTGRDGMVRICERDGSASIGYRPLGQYFWQMTWLPDGKLLLGDSHGLVSRFDPAARLHSKSFATLGSADVTIENLCLSADESRLIVATYLNPKNKNDTFAPRNRQFTFETLNLSDGKRAAAPVAVPEPGMDAYSDGTRTIVTGKWLRVELRDGANRHQLYAPNGEGGQASDTVKFALSSDRTRVTGLIRDFVDIKAMTWDAATGERQSEMQVQDSFGVKEFAFGFSPNGRLVVVYLHGDRPSLQILDLEKQKQLRKLEPLMGLQGAVRPVSAAISDDGNTVFLGDANGKIHIWNLETEQEKLIFQAHSGRVGAMVLSADSNTLYSAGGGTIAVWDRTGQ